MFKFLCVFVPRSYHSNNRISKVFQKNPQNRVRWRLGRAQVKGMKQTTQLETTNEIWLTTGEICAFLKISKNTLAKWRQRNVAPRAIRLPNGELRTRSDWLDDFLLDETEVA